MEKNWYKSKTVYMNVILSLMGIATLIVDTLEQGNNQIIGVSGWVLLFYGVLGVILRIWFTDTPIARKK